MILNITLGDYHFTDLFSKMIMVRYTPLEREIFLFLKEEYGFYLDKIRILDTCEDWYGDGIVNLKHTIVEQNYCIENEIPRAPRDLESLIFFKKSKTDRTFDLEVDDDILTQFMLEFR